MIGSFEELGKLKVDAKDLRKVATPWCSCRERERHKWEIPMRPNTDATFSGGSGCSSEEGAVMALERRTRVTRVDCLTNTLINASRDI